MPKRSNQFQRLITNIYAAMSNMDGGKVSESIFLTEPNGIKREIDILLEKELYGHLLRIAVECRDHSRKSDIEWVDNLIGKYKNIKVNKIIAVSKSGFSEKAAQKALDNNIELRTLEECLLLDWMKEFYELKIGGFKIGFKVKSIKMDLFPFSTKTVELIPKIIDADGNDIGNISIFIKTFYKKFVFPEILKFMEEKHYQSCKTVPDLHRKFDMSFYFNVKDIYITSTDNLLFTINNIVYNIEANPEIFNGKISHFKYGERTGVSIGSIKYDEFNISLNIVQVVGSNLLQLSIDGKDEIKYIECKN
jgi:hypothetical protein